MFRLVMNVVATLVVLGLTLALLITFDWDIGAVGAWAWGRTIWLIGMIADWFMTLAWFQGSVSS